MPEPSDSAYTSARTSERDAQAARIQSADQQLSSADNHAKALLHELASMIDGTGRYIRIALELLEQGNAAAALDALQVADGAVDSMTAVIKSRAVTEAEAIRSIGDTVVHAFKNNQPTHHAIATAISIQQPVAIATNARLGLNIETSVLEVGPLPIFAVVQNAVRNAIEAIAKQDGGRIEVDASVVPDPDRQGESCLLILVVDDGPGIFTTNDPFQLGSSTREPQEGGGIGLTICKDVVESLGGQVSLGAIPASRSDFAWATTCFSALIPLNTQDADLMIGEPSSSD